jgi:N-glycosylase/DNA lyase
MKIKKGGGKIKKYKKINSVQDWLPIEKIFNNGIIKLKNDNFIKIIKIIPINYNLKSELEKESILNSYKVFLKTCNFNLQILIQSKKEDLSKHISSVNNSSKKENKNIKKISENYINFINQLNINKKSATKNFYIILKIEKNKKEKNVENLKNNYNIIFDELNDQFLKIKDSLSRCGNTVLDINNKEECKQILFSFFYPKTV